MQLIDHPIIAVGAAGKLAESPSASSADNFVAILDGNTSVFHYWA